MNDSEKLNWLLNEAGHTRADLDKAIELDELLNDIVAAMGSGKSNLPSFEERFNWVLSYHNETIGEKGLAPLNASIVDAEILSDNAEFSHPRNED